MAVLLFTNKPGGTSLARLRCGQLREHSVYELNAAIISLENIRVAAKLICGGGLYGRPCQVQGKCSGFLLRQVFNSKNELVNFNMPKTISSTMWPAAK